MKGMISNQADDLEREMRLELTRYGMLHGELNEQAVAIEDAFLKNEIFMDVSQTR